ncbi:MAG TPA: hypothetical protein VF062_22355 [Candidatus Limnocylindrales bacterium]
MAAHDIHVDLIIDEDTEDNAYRAFCECGWADPDGWHHADTFGVDHAAVVQAHAAAVAAGESHLSQGR